MLNKQQKDLLKGIKISPKAFDFGHGQSFAYSPQTKSIWFSRDNSSSRGFTDQYTSKFVEVSASTLKPTGRTSNFRILAGTNTPVTEPHNLTFDNNGNWYYWTNNGKQAKIYKGSMNKRTGKVTKVQLVQRLSYSPGTRTQSISYNSKNKRLYLVADDSIVSMPASKLGKLKVSDVKYNQYNTTREFESFQFDNSYKPSKGHALLLTNKGSELLQSTVRVK